VGSPGSLILGGYDARRIRRNNITFPFGGDVERSHTVALRNIYFSPQNGAQKFPLPGIGNADISPVIESHHPYFYLPHQLCENIAEKLNAEYSPQHNQYFTKTPAAHPQLNPSLTFEISPLLNSTSTVNITLPYTSLILHLEYLIGDSNVSQTLSYVPIRRAENGHQYALGRAFLQDAVLISDYERNSFSVHSAVHNGGSEHRPILPGNSSTLDSWNQDNKAENNTPNPSKLGIIVGASVGGTILIILMLLTYCLIRRHKQGAAEQGLQNEESMRLPASAAGPGLFQELGSTTSPSGTDLVNSPAQASELADSPLTQVSELGSSHPASSELAESSGAAAIARFFATAELGSRQIFEMDGTQVSGTEKGRLGLGMSENIPPATPIPQTPNEYYGRRGRPNRSGMRMLNTRT
jgi:hypothetical protein